MNYRRSHLTHISSIINNKLGHDPLFTIFRNWKEIVGPTIFKVAAPIKLKDNLLIVAVTTHPWLQELTLSKHIILKKISHFSSDIKDVQFILKRKDRRSLKR